MHGSQGCRKGICENEGAITQKYDNYSYRTAASKTWASATHKARGRTRAKTRARTCAELWRAGDHRCSYAHRWLGQQLRCIDGHSDMGPRDQQLRRADGHGTAAPVTSYAAPVAAAALAPMATATVPDTPPPG